MIDYVKGTVVYKSADGIVVENGGLGYRILTTSTSASELFLEEEATVYTELVVREDAMFLVGFSSREELEVYRLLVTVSGVGPRVALSALSSIHYDELCAAISDRNIKVLQTAQGIGKKTAERMVLELKDKVSVSVRDAARTGYRSKPGELDAVLEEEVVGALMALGYTKTEANRLLDGLETEGLTTEELVRMALMRSMSE